jgi:polar amino acid transport system substrate-binding protein
VLTVGSEIDFPPFEFKNESNGDPEGFDVDVANALGAQLGVKMSFVNANFAGLVAGVQAGRYDLAMSALADTPQRQQIVNFVNYGIASAGLLVQPGNPLHIKSLSDMCGHSVGVQAGSVPAVPITEEQSKECVADGKPKINMETLQSGSDIYLALESKRIDIGFAGGPDAQYFLKQKPGAFDIVTTAKLVTGAFGIAVAKTNLPLAEALKAAMQAILNNGTYAHIIAQWKLSTVAVTRTAINNTPPVYDSN